MRLIACELIANDGALKKNQSSKKSKKIGGSAVICSLFANLGSIRRHKKILFASNIVQN